MDMGQGPLQPQLLGMICQSNAPEFRILMVGLPIESGTKTTILHKFRLPSPNEHENRGGERGERGRRAYLPVVTQTPFSGFNVQTIKYKNMALTVYDVGGQGDTPDGSHRTWKEAYVRRYYTNTEGIIFVVETCSGATGFSAGCFGASDALRRMLSDRMVPKGAPLLIFVNDAGWQSPAVLAEELNLTNYLYRDRPWFIQSIDAQTGNGMYEGLRWFSNAIKKLQ